MKIGIDCRLWNESGVGRYVRNLVYYLQKLDTKNEYILFVLSKDKETIATQIVNNKFEIKIADVRWHTASEQFTFPKILKQEHLDLMHFPYFSAPIFYRGNYVVTIHDLILHHLSTGKASTRHPLVYQTKMFGYRYIVQKVVKQALKIITVSQSTKDDIVQTLHVPSSKIAVTYEGVDIRIDKSKRNRPLENPYFLYVGNAYPHKNISRLIEAFRKIELHHPEMVLILVGRDDYFYKKMREEVKKAEMGKSILFYGQIDDEELSQLYRYAKALVSPSLLEGFGLTNLEALAYGCPVVTSDIPAHREILKGAALYFDPKSVDSISEAMEHILTDKELILRKKLGEKVVSSFSFEQMAKETLAIYLESAA